MAGKMDEHDQHSGQFSFSTVTRTLSPKSITERNTVKKLVFTFFPLLIVIFVNLLFRQVKFRFGSNFSTS